VKPAIRIGIVGLGGFAASHHQVIARLEERGHARLVCTCDPDPDRYGGEQANLRFVSRGVQVFRDYRAMLDACHRQLDLVVIPTPIQLHADMHAAATAHGLPTYLEKPPTLDYAELERMIQADARAHHASHVGFNFIIEKRRLALKERLLAGEFGAVRSPRSGRARQATSRATIGPDDSLSASTRCSTRASATPWRILSTTCCSGWADRNCSVGRRSPRCGRNSTGRTRSRVRTRFLSKPTPRAA
jgi:predicted dehydrogenase